MRIATFTTVRSPRHLTFPSQKRGVAGGRFACKFPRRRESGRLSVYYERIIYYSFRIKPHFVGS